MPETGLREQWRVTAYGPSGDAYVYQVTAPAGASEMLVTQEAYVLHGQKYRDGKVSEFLGPQCTTERIA